MMGSLIRYLYVYVLVFSGVNSTSYNAYKVYSVTPETFSQAELLHSLSNDPRFDFWLESQSIDNPSNIMVAPEDQGYFEQELLGYGLAYNILIANVESVIQKEKIERSLTRASTRMGIGDVTFSNFMYYGEQMAYVRRLAQDYPNLVTVETIGQSHEGRDILILKISNGPSQSSVPKPVIFIDAGIHCREWIAPPVALYIIHQLIENTTNAPLYQNVDWAIVPNLNPDGYEYTQTTNRLWRKNRRLTEGVSCYGTDLNRNFGYYWMHAGASNISCSETYAGPEAFSEPEARALRDWLTSNLDNVRLYLTFHSYGQYLLYPWGYAGIYPDDAEELQYLGDLAGKAIAKASTIGSSYYVNNSAIGLYPAAGASDDWVKSIGVELSYTVELPNTGAPYGFMIPAKNILPVVQETWAGVQVFRDYIEEKFYTNLTLIRDAPFDWRNV